MKRIDKRDIEDILALTPMQEGMLFHYLKNPGSDLYFEQLCLEVSGEIDMVCFEKAWNFVVDTNEMLRTIFRWKKMKKPTQVILKQYNMQVRYWDISGQDTGEKKKRVNEIRTKDKSETFDLHDVPFRITLIKIAKARHEIIISNHHILYDGWSNGIILDEFFTAYTDLYHNKIPLKPIKNKFKAYIQWIHSQDRKREEKYWREYLKGFDTPMELSIKQKSGKEISSIETLSILFNQETGEQLERPIHHCKITMAALLYGAWALLLQGYNNSDEVIFGTTVSGRTARINGIEHMVGLFINTLPLRIRFHAREKITHWLKRIHNTLQTREAYESTPLVRTKEYSQLKPDEALFDTIVVIENYPLNKRFSHDNSQLSLNSYSMFEMTNYDLTVEITLAGEIRANFIYNRECLEKDTIKRLALHFKSILTEISTHPGKGLHEIEILSEKEKRKILYDFNDTTAEYSEDKAIHQLFEEQVKRTPDHIALIGVIPKGVAPPAYKKSQIPNKEESFGRILNARGGNISITYRELNEKANQLAQLLREKGIKPDTIVAIMVERSLEMVIGIMCILKAGGAYLPIDPGYPGESIKFILADSRPGALISPRAFTVEVNKGIKWEGETIFLDEGNMLTCPAAHPHLSPLCCSSVNSLAYVIYTSGSTGKPKGVMVEHASVVNLLKALQNLYPLTEFDTYLLKTSYIFDVSVAELFGWFWQGGRIAVLEVGGEKDPKKIIDTIECRVVTHVNFVPSMFNAFVDGLTPRNIHKLSSLKYIFLAGEAVLPELVNKFNRFHLPIVLENIYGPTEATVYSSKYSLSGWYGRGSVPIGKPLSNIKLYILDRNSHLQPLGVPGELVITGVGLARGYLNRPGLTAEKFINSLYRTGDLARWQPDGNIEFLGRMDYQVKVRGFRVELEEVESKLLAHEDIKAAVVVAREDKWGERYLAAYWASTGGRKPPVSEIKKYLLKSLPDYMIPGYFINIEKIPLTVSGKIDRKALPTPGIISRRQYTPPQNELQEKLVAIWWEVLGIERGKIGINDNFFELGGHSLKAIGLVGRLHRAFDIEIPLTSIFRIPTVRQLANYIGRSEKSKYQEINPVEEKEYYPLWASQKSQFILHGMDTGNTAYNMTGVMKLTGEVEKARLEKVFMKLIHRHQGLRTSFEIVDDTPAQRIHKKIPNYKLKITKTIKNFVKPFDLSKAPLMRIGLIKQDEKEFLFLVDMHHIISDGASVQVLINDFMGLYAGEELPALKLQYKDFSVWQNKRKESSSIKKQEAYWSREFSREIPVLNLCTDFLRPGAWNFAGDILEFELGTRETAKLKHIAREEKSTLFMLLFALFYVLLAKVSGQEEILVGTPIVGRTHPDWEPIIGMFVNVLAIRNYPARQKTFSSFLQEVKGKTLLAYENQEYPFEKLVKNLEISRDPGRNPLFDVMFAYQDMNIVQLEAESLKLEPCNYKTGISKFDLTLLVKEYHENLFFAFEYSTKLFKEATIGRFIQYFKNIVSRVLIRPQERISGLEIISDQEKQRVLFDFNRTRAEYPEDKTFYHLFADQVEKAPDAAALVYEDQCITYCESSKTANRLAHRLKQRSVKPGTIVAIMVRPSIGMITGLLGILKAGAAFLPIDPDYPGERIQYMLTDSSVGVLLTTPKLQVKVKAEVEEDFREPQQLPLQFINIEAKFAPAFEPLPSTLTSTSTCQVSATNLAYVIYTSGSTGRPKGVLVGHRALNNLCHWHNKHFFVTANDRAVKYANFGFDASVWEIFPYLIIGASLYVLNDDIKMDILRLNEYFENNRISIAFLPTQVCEQFMTLSNRSLRILLTGGDQLKRFIKRDYQLVNNYGPTENTVVSTSFVVEDSYPNIPIGSPIDNTCIYILDKSNNVQPIGIPGELSVSGHGLARGYLNQPELTIERFCLRRPGGHFLKKLPPWTPRKNFLLEGSNKNHLQSCNHASMMLSSHHSPHYPITPLPHHPIYRTGDLARWLPDGNIEFLGRIDHQVKIRGFRIELGEIENHLLNHPHIKQAVVIAKEKNNKDKYLCAYVVPKGRPPVPELKKYLSGSLPGYMIPSYFVMLDRMPLTPGGKLDRKILPEPGIKAGEGYVAPGSPIEKKLEAIWQEVLNPERNKIGIHDDFFALGGHSLKATVLISKIYKEFKVRVPLAAIFNTPTIKGLGEYIKGCSRETYVSLEPVESKEYYALSSAQKRLYILQQMDLDSTAYNIPVFMVVGGSIEKEKIEAIFRKLIQRHESLRSSFMFIDEEPVQRIQVDVKVKGEEQRTDGRRQTTEEKKQETEDKRQKTEGKSGTNLSSVIRHLSSEFIRPFDMSKAPLLRVELTQIEENKNLLMVDMHHIVSDGMSIELLIKEFTALYTGQKLPALKLRYRDYSEWQQRKYHREELTKQEVFWRRRMEGDIPPLQLPTDFVRPKVFDFEGKRVNFEITPDEANRLKELALEERTTLYILLLSMFNVFLSKITDQEIIVVGTAVAGRRHADLEQIFGMFVNTLALINYPGSQKFFSEFLQEVNRETSEALENQDYPFEKLVEKVVLNRDTSRNPLFDVMFALQPLDFKGIQVPGLSLYPYDYETNLAKFDLMLQAVEQNENLSFIIEYRTSLFKESTIQRFIRCFKKIIGVVTEQPAVKLGEIEFIPEDEKKRLLSQFNNIPSGYPKEKLIHQLFEEGEEKRPHQIAAAYKDQSLSYRLLNQRADKLAGYLRSKGVKSDEPVAMMLKVSLEMIAAVLAILKAGGAYLPIDPDYPLERIKYILDDSRARVLLQDNKNKINAPIILDFKHLDFDFVSNVESCISDLTPANLAYIIYTSGTTGRPKGVMVEHENVVRLFFNDQFQFDFTRHDVWTMFHSYCFDFSVWEMYGALLFGGKLVLIGRMTARDTKYYLQILKREGVTILNQTPSAFYRLIGEELQYLDHKSLYLKYVIFGGEALNPSQLKEWKCKYPETRLINMYGITETTVHVTYKELTDEEIDSGKSNIGKPIPTLSTYIMNKNRQLMPIGTTGELCIGGAGVSRGYLNHPGWTTEKFIDNPYKPGETLYCSGDLVRYLDNGDMQYLGRMDHQVKIRGYRIELGEIERCLSNHNEIDEAVVIAREEQVGEKYLCAYVVSKIGIDTEDLRAFLHHSLPEYMLPAVFVPLEKLPLTPNGKIDLKALPEPKNILRKKYTAPRNSLESKLADIWASILNQSSSAIGIHDNFFQMGGHSLKATLLASKINKIFDVNMPLTEIFTSPTIRELAAYIKEAVKAQYLPIASTEKKEYYAVSSSQKRLYVLQQMDPLSIAYNIPSVFELEGRIDETRLKNTFGTLIKRHENFRTSFELRQEEPVQKIYNEVEFEIEYYYAERKEQSAERKEDRHALCAMRHASTIKNFIRFFDLSQVPLLRVGLIRVPKDEAERHDAQKHIMMVDMHHIISDGISIEILIKEFKILYEGEELPELPIQYKEFSEWQNSRNMKGASKEHEEYWVKEFKGEIPVLNLPIDYNRPVVQGFEGRVLRFEVTPEETAAINKYTLEEGATLFMLLLSIYMIFLSKLTNQEDIVVGIPVSGRQYPGLENIMGMFVNTLAIRSFPGGEKTFEQFLLEVKARTLEAFAHQDYPFEDLVNAVAVNRDTSRNPLFDTMLAVNNLDTPNKEIPGLKLKPYKLENFVQISKFDLTLTVLETETTLLFTFEYCTRLFKKETIERYFQYFKKTLSNVLERPNAKISEIEIISEEEKKKILYDFINTDVEYPKNKKIQKLFEEQVQKTPNHMALIFKDKQLSYQHLNERAEQLAADLTEPEGRTGSLAVLMVERSIEMIVGILAVLKGGGTYLPIDPQYPGKRIQYMCDDSEAQLLLTQYHLSDLLARIRFRGVIIEIDDERIYKSKPHYSGSGIVKSSQNPAYVIYTSGSTGKPKGVLVEHFSVINLALSQKMQFNMTEKDRVLQFSTFCFDASVEQIFIALFSGAVLVLVDKDTLLEAGNFEEFIASRSITHIHAVPSFLDMMKLNCAYNLKRIISGGDICPVSLAKQWSKYCDFYNEYGPTETTVTSIEMQVKEVDETSLRLPIGRPINNTFIYIYDRWMQPVPPGVTGELYIGGEGVARGYLNRPTLTTEKFVFWEGDRLYRTGDLARWLWDGNIEFLGRMDHQVKIRGFRIEPGEVEYQLLNHELVKEAIIIAGGDNDSDRYICAYIVPRVPADTTMPLEVPEIREFLSKRLPDYMIPSYFVQLDKIPLTPSGKIDRSRLPGHKPGIAADQYTPPQNKIEEKLVKIWSAVLRIEKEKIGIHDNFFELGGHSLKAALLMAKIHKTFDVNIPLTEIFTTPTIRELAAYIKEAAKDRYIPINPTEKKEYYAASSAQKQLYVLQQMDEHGIGYNIPSLFKLEGRVDKNKFENTFNQLINRHESLRTYFEMIESQPAQRVHGFDRVEFGIEYYDMKQVEAEAKVEENLSPRSEGTRGLASLPEDSYLSSVIRHLSSEFIRPYDLSKAPLLRVGIIKLPHTPAALRRYTREGTYNSQEEKKGKYLLIVDMHHIISDGMSVELLIKEFTALYTGQTLPWLKLRYSDYSEWQNQRFHREELKEQEVFWRQQLAGGIPQIQLPTDFSRPKVLGFEGKQVNFEITKEETNGLKELALKEGTTLYILLLCMFNIFLSKITGQEAIVVGTAVAGRRHADLEQIFGMFVNTLALINYPLSQKPFNEFLRQVNRKTLQAFENQDYPFEKLVEKADLNRDTSRNPLFDVMFALQPLVFKGIDVPGLKVYPYDYETNTAKFDLMLQAVEENEKLLFTIEYSTNLFTKSTIQRFIFYFKKILAVVKEPAVKLGEIEIISQIEKNKILSEFNNTTWEYPKNQSIHRLFENEVEKRPRQIAVVYEDQSISYRELNRRAKRLAAYLQDKGVKFDAPVGIMLDASLEVIIGVLAILKAGGAYLPIDPDYPVDRIKFMLIDSNAEVLITTPELRFKVENKGGQPQGLPLDPGAGFEVPPSTLTSTLRSKSVGGLSLPQPLAYIIYTSGSTGRPKGVMVEHQNVNRLVKNTNYIDFKPDDRILQTGALEFDASTFEIWGALLNGLILYLAPKEKLLNPELLKKMIAFNGITTMWLTAPLFNQMVQTGVDIFTALRNLLVGGDVLSPHHINQIRRRFPRLNIINGYGPTENTTFSTTFLIEKEYKDNIPIGKPIANSTAYIVDKNNQLQPIGIAGELWVGGDGVSRGYLNNPELTAEKFDHDLWKYQDYHDRKNKSFLGGPGGRFFKKAPLAAGGKLYRTGDLTRWFPDGNIEFLGRIDQQVKIRGFRIEPKEIEYRLLSQNHVKEAVVQVRTDEKGEKYLCAYLVSDHQLIPSELRENLSADLPDYMIPPYFVQIEKIPLTPSGKIDRNKLLGHKPEIAANQYTPPQNEIEERLVEIWSKVLEIEKEKIGIHDNFFQMGGHSLRAVALIARIHKELEVNVPLTEIFRIPTIRELSQYIKHSDASKYISIKPLEKKTHYELSSAQKRIYLLQQKDLMRIDYNMTGVFTIAGSFQKKKTEKIFRSLIRRHEALRTSFRQINEGVVQKIDDEVTFSIQFGRVSSETHIKNRIKKFIKPFDLNQAPLLRVEMIQVEEQKHYVLYDLHHIISDGISMKILEKDFISFWEGKAPEPILIHYKDYTVWQNKALKTQLVKQELYWLNRMKGFLFTRLPADKTDYSEEEEGKKESRRFDKDVYEEIEKFCDNYQVTRSTFLISIFNIILALEIGQMDITIGIPFANRKHYELGNVIGIFLNILLIRTVLEPGDTLLEVLAKNTKTVLEAVNNSDYPYELLSERIRQINNLKHSELFSISYNYLPGKENIGKGSPDFRIKPVDIEEIFPKIDMTLYVRDTGNDIKLDLVYKGNRIDEYRVKRIMDNFSRINHMMLTHKNTRIKDINLEVETVSCNPFQLEMDDAFNNELLI